MEAGDNKHEQYLNSRREYERIVRMKKKGEAVDEIEEQQKRQQYLEHKREYDRDNQDKRREYYQEHKDELNEKRKLYRATNKEKVKEQRKKYNELHKEDIKLKNKQYNELHKEELKLKHKEYQQLNKDKRKEYAKEYNTRREVYDRKCEDIQCECGDILRKACLWKHKLTRGHILNMKRDEPKEIMDEINKKIDVYHKQYYQDKTISRVELN
jgi:anion-transporting  ArsA/GET3 family ATPase